MSKLKNFGDVPNDLNPKREIVRNILFGTLIIDYGCFKKTAKEKELLKIAKLTAKMSGTK